MFNGCKPGQITESVPQDSTSYPVHVRKPNIYLYPPEKTTINVNINFPNGGELINSDPPYNEGWEITVDPSGKIDNKYDYLFYECITPDLYQYLSGWVVKRENLALFYQDKLNLYGFSPSEIKDFLDYWISRLNAYSFYIIYPQIDTNLNQMIQLKINPAPDSINRLFFCIKGTKTQELNLEEVKIESMMRAGFTVVEWGVVLK